MTGSTSGHPPKWTVYLGAAAAAAAILGYVGLRPGGGDSAQTTGTQQPSSSAPQQSAVPTAQASESPKTGPLPTAASYSVTAQIATTYRAGKDKAFACDSAATDTADFCLELEPLVVGPDGPVKDGCHLSYEFYAGQKPSGNPITRGYDQSIYPCVPDASVDVVLPDIKGVDLPPGPYTFVMHMELDDGTTASGTYNFSLVDRGGG